MENEKWRNFPWKKLFSNTLNNDVFVSGKHKVIFEEFKSGTTKYMSAKQQTQS